MGTHAIFLDLFLILLTARVLGELFTRLGIPSVLGEVGAGVLLGVSLLGWVEPSQTLRVLAEIGIVLLLFEIGLDTDVQRLVHMGHKSIIIALFGAAVIDDIIGVIMLVFIYDYATVTHFTLHNTLTIASAILIFLLIAPIAANLFSNQLRKMASHEQVPGMLPTMIIALILLLSYLSGKLGAPEILGSFAAGIIALSRRFFLPFGLGLQQNPEFLKKVKGSMTAIT